MKEAGDSPGWTRAVRNTNFLPLSGLWGSEKQTEEEEGAEGGVEGRKRWCFKYTQLPGEETTSDIIGY